MLHNWIVFKVCRWFTRLLWDRPSSKLEYCKLSIFYLNKITARQLPENFLGDQKYGKDVAGDEQSFIIFSA